MNFESTPENDVVGKSGWLYADSFLALTVVFLATVSFIPSVESSSPNPGKGSVGLSGSVNSSTQQRDLKPFAVQFQSTYDLNLLNQQQINLQTILMLDISQWLDRYNLARKTRVIDASITGGFSTGENQTAGIARAESAYALISSSDPLLFPTNSTKIKVQQMQKKDLIQIRLTFGV